MPPHMAPFVPRGADAPGGALDGLVSAGEAAPDGGASTTGKAGGALANAETKATSHSARMALLGRRRRREAGNVGGDLEIRCSCVALGVEDIHLVGITG